MTQEPSAPSHLCAKQYGLGWILAVCLLLVALSACGQTGDLYLPEPPEKTKQKR